VPATATVTGTPQVATATPGAAIRKDLNPLTGLGVADSSLLKIPALLISISHFPATARPQAGLSFAPFVYEFYITEGATRFLALFYGEFPAVKLPIAGGCETREGPFVRAGTLLGNFVWYDSNANGLQDTGEGGIAGLCVALYDDFDNALAHTTTDSNGFYGFNVKPGKYSVELTRPQHLEFTTMTAGDDARDSDVDPASGRAVVNVSADDLSLDAGLIPIADSAQDSSPLPELPAAQVGPIRSGRLIYRHIAQFFQDSCLIYGGASPEVLALLPKCLIVFHQASGGGFMLDLQQMQQVARANRPKGGSTFDYSGYVYQDQPPEGGEPASQLWVDVAYQNQSAWYYDPLLQGYYRYVDTSEKDQAGILHAEVDRLTTRQLHVENLIVLFAKHKVISPTNLDILLDPGRTGKALLFRDGLKFNIDWSTVRAKNADGEGTRPIQFLQKDGQLAPLKPGHTWILVVTPETTVEAKTAGQWLLSFIQPFGAK
jgi:hypothetical protein